jgi:PAS domain S-box-containing protein
MSLRDEIERLLAVPARALGGGLPVSGELCVATIERMRSSLAASVAAAVRRFAASSVEQSAAVEAVVAKLERHGRQQTVLAQFGQRALGGVDLGVLMDEAVALAAEALEVEYAKILEMLPDGRALLLRSGVGWAPGMVGRATVGIDRDSQAGYTLLAKRPVVVRDLRCESRFSGPALLREHGVVSGISVVIHGRRSPFGVFGIHTTREVRFSVADADFLQALGNVVATAIERKAAESKFSELIESAPDATIVVDREGTMVLVNSRAEALFGYDRTEMLGQAVEMLVPRHERTSHVGRRAQFSAHPHGRLMSRGKELFALRKNGTTFPAEIGLSSVGTDHGMLVYAAVRDVTERRRIAETLRLRVREVEESHDRIEAQSRELQAQAAELTAARDAALAAVDAKSEFLANMSHEIRTPMNGIFGTVEMLLGMQLSDDQRELVEIAQRSATGLLRVIDDILDFSKIEAGALTLNVVDFDLVRGMHDASQIVVHAADAKGIEYRCELDPKLPASLRGDPMRLRQVLVNLLGNAVKFTKRGQVVLRATVAGETRSHVSIHFSVADTGIGISPKDRGRLFQSFLQLDGSSTREYGGTGLGLAISKRIVEAMGGSIGVESVPGEGSIFWFTIPFEHATAAVSTSEIDPRGGVPRGASARLGKW